MPRLWWEILIIAVFYCMVVVWVFIRHQRHTKKYSKHMGWKGGGNL